MQQSLVMPWCSATHRLRADIIAEVMEQMRVIDRSRRSDEQPNYFWLSRRGGCRLLSKQQVWHLERLASRLDFDGCHTALQRLRTALSTESSRLCYTASQVPEIAESVILQVICDRQRADMIRAVTESRRQSSAFVRRFSERRVAPLATSSSRPTTLGYVNTVSHTLQRREAVRKTVSFSSKSQLDWPQGSTSGEKGLILKPILKENEAYVH